MKKRVQKKLNKMLKNAEKVNVKKLKKTQRKVIQESKALLFAFQIAFENIENYKKEEKEFIADSFEMFEIELSRFLAKIDYSSSKFLGELTND